MKRPILALVALVMFAVMISAAWVGLSRLEHPVRVSRTGS